MLINLIYLMIILPLVWMAVDKSQARWKRSLIICFGYFLLYKLTLLIPSYVPWLRTESLNWNWSGKLLAILFSVGFYFAFQSLFKDNLLKFDLLYFVKTFSLGVIWSTMAIRTRSLLLPIVSHNLSNTLANWIGMIK